MLHFQLDIPRYIEIFFSEIPVLLIALSILKIGDYVKKIRIRGSPYKPTFSRMRWQYKGHDSFVSIYS